MTGLFEREKKTYSDHLKDLLPSMGKWVLIKGEEIHGTYDTFEAAFMAGFEHYGLDPFFVKEIELDEKVILITRLIA